MKMVTQHMTCLFTSPKFSNVITVEAIKNFNTIHMGVSKNYQITIVPKGSINLFALPNKTIKFSRFNSRFLRYFG